MVSSSHHWVDGLVTLHNRLLLVHTNLLPQTVLISLPSHQQRACRSATFDFENQEDLLGVGTGGREVSVSSFGHNDPMAQDSMDGRDVLPSARVHYDFKTIRESGDLCFGQKEIKASLRQW